MDSDMKRSFVIEPYNMESVVLKQFKRNVGGGSSSPEPLFSSLARSSGCKV